MFCQQKISFNDPVKLYDPLTKFFKIYVDKDKGGKMVLFGFCQYVAYYGFVSPCVLHLNYVGIISLFTGFSRRKELKLIIREISIMVAAAKLKLVLLIVRKY